MAVTDLSAPIERPKWTRFLPKGVLQAATIALLGLSGVLLASPTIWVFLTDDPLGGEPITVVSLMDQVERFSDQALDLGAIRSPDDSDVALARRLEDGGWSYDEGRDVLIGGPRIAGDEEDLTSLSFQPDPRLVDERFMGLLPRIGDDGARPLDVYSAPLRVSAIEAPKIAIIMGGMGLSQTRSLQAIETLPNTVTFAFSPYGASLERWMIAARKNGHELLMQLPLEPFDYPDNDPGPHTLLLEATEQENMNRLHWVLSRLTNYVGLINEGGGRFLASPESVGGLADELAARGLMFVEDGASSRTAVRQESGRAGLPSLSADALIDTLATPEDIQSKLLQLEQLARSRGHAVGIATALPVTIDQIAAWAADLEDRGVHIVPITAIEATLSGRLN